LDTEKCNRRIGIAKRKLQQRNQPANETQRREREKKNKAGSFPGPSNPNLLPLGFLRVRVRVPGFKS
jgi:hypothetical protein